MWQSQNCLFVCLLVEILLWSWRHLGSFFSCLRLLSLESSWFSEAQVFQRLGQKARPALTGHQDGVSVLLAGVPLAPPAVSLCSVSLCSKVGSSPAAPHLWTLETPLPRTFTFLLPLFSNLEAACISSPVIQPEAPSAMKLPEILVPRTEVRDPERADRAGCEAWLHN